MADLIKPAQPMDAVNDLTKTKLTTQTVMPINGVSPIGDPMVNPIAAPPTAPTATAAAPTPISSFGPDNNLTGSQINPVAPTATAPTATATGTTTASAPKTSDFGTGAIQAGASPQSDSNFQNYTTGFNNALSNISNGPNRTQLALQALQDFDTAGQPQLEAGFRRVGQRAAALGRIGSGMTTNDLTGLEGTYQRDRGLAARGLARDVAEGDINDRYRTADVYSNARSQQYGFGNTDRNYNTGVDQYNQGALFDRQRAGNDAQSGYEDRLFGQQSSLRGDQRYDNSARSDYEDRLYNQQRTGQNDLRGERDFQTSRADKALEDQIRQRVLEEQLLGDQFGRASTRQQVGSSGNPADYYMDSAKQQQGEADSLFGGAGDLLRSRQATQPVQSGSPVLTEEILKRILGGG